jgi:nitrile hydratase subunit alpha
MSDQTLARRAHRLEQHLVENGHVHSDDLDAAIAAAEAPSGDQPSTALGARVVARAWAEPPFRDHLVAHPVEALSEYSPQPVPIAVLVNTPALHHVIVCTLCSCYPSALLGLPPAWYKSFEYRSRVVREPRSVLAEFGIEIRVHDSTAEQRHLVLPLRPPGTDGWSQERLAALVTRNSMIGTGHPLRPGRT